MRITEQEQHTIKSTVRHYDPQARVLLFGSRTDPDKKGGDIDLLVISEKLGFTDKLNILADLHDTLGEQKIDILLLSRRAGRCWRLRADHFADGY